MSQIFLKNDPTLESQWRALILFGKNSATYKFAFAKTLLEAVVKDRTAYTLQELSEPFVRNILDHITTNDKQGISTSSKFLGSCRDYLNKEISYDELLRMTERYGFINVVDAFQNVNGGRIPDVFYEMDYTGRKQIIIKDDFFKLGET